VFKNKPKPIGTINKYKVHLVAKGYKQMWHVDYFDTNSSVGKIYLLEDCMQSIFKFVVHQMDVKIVL